MKKCNGVTRDQVGTTFLGGRTDTGLSQRTSVLDVKIKVVGRDRRETIRQHLKSLHGSTFDRGRNGK